MADVTGTIGNDTVILNNAATESTLQALLTAIQGKAGAAAAQQVASTAAIAGINAAGVSLNNLSNTSNNTAKASSVFEDRLKKVNAASDTLRNSFEEFEKQFGPLIGKLVQGTANASDLFGSFTQLKGVVGLTAVLFQKVAAFQEQNLATYQSISTAGANFGGSLTQMRMAAQNTYMSLEQFTNLMKANGETFAKMGSNANDGAIAFTKLSNSLLKSDAGDSLRALGYTTDQVNQGMLSYIAVTGGRSKQELQNTEKITKGASEYLTQLDALAVITGKSREEQEKALKEASANAAYEAYLQTLDEEGRKKATLAMQNALATGGKGGADLLKSQLLGLPPMTEAAQKLQAVGPNVAAGIKDMGTAVQSVNGTVRDVNKGYAKAQAGATKDIEKFGKTADALSFGTDATSQAIMGLRTQANRTTAQGIKNQEDAERQLDSVAANQKARRESEAKSAVEAQKAVQEMGQALMAVLLPAIKLLTPVVNAVIGVFGALANIAAEYKTITFGLVAALTAYLAIQKLAAAKQALAQGATTADTLKGMFGVSKGQLGSLTNPMHVILVGRVAGGAGGKGAGTGAGGAGTGAGGKTTPANREERLARVAEGRQLQQTNKLATTALKGAGVVGAIAGLASLGFDLSDIKKQKEEGKISEEEAKKQTGGAVGEAGGGLAGGLAGAAAGAALGSFVPIIGTAIGGLIGGAIGAYGGGAIGKKSGETLMGSNEEKPKMAQGGIITKPTEVLAGEAGPEAIIPLKQFESLRVELEMLNKQSAEMIKYLKETADYTKRNVDATKSLSGDLFKF